MNKIIIINSALILLSGPSIHLQAINKYLSDKKGFGGN